MGENSRKRKQRHQDRAAVTKPSVPTTTTMPPPQPSQAAKRPTVEQRRSASADTLAAIPSAETTAGDPVAAGVYHWAASVGLGVGKKAKELLIAVQDIRFKRRESYSVTFWLPSGEERTARARVTNGKVLLELIPSPEEEDYDDYDPTDTISVNLNGRIVAMFDRNGMKWDTALQALIRDGEIMLSDEQKKLVETEV